MRDNFARTLSLFAFLFDREIQLLNLKNRQQEKNFFKVDLCRFNIGFVYEIKRT